MKGNFTSLTEFAQELERRETAKNDFLVDTRKVSMMPDGDTLRIEGAGMFGINDHAHQQIAARLQIPKKYYDRMAELPELRARNVNDWFENTPEKRMVRTLDDTARAFLSDRYRPIDDHFIMNAIAPVLYEHQDLQIMSQGLSETHLYLQVKFPKLQGEVKQGDVVQAGITLTNSEVGSGAFNIRSMEWVLACTNGMIGESLIRKYHVGRRTGNDTEDYDIYADDTIKAELESYRLRMRDILRHALNETAFNERLLKLRKADSDKIEKPVGTVENVTKRYFLSEKENESILTNLMGRGEQPSRWGLTNAITALAHKQENLDRQFEYEKIGSDLIELKPSEWEVLQAS